MPSVTSTSATSTAAPCSPPPTRHWLRRSVGLRAYVALCEGSSPDDVVFLDELPLTATGDGFDWPLSDETVPRLFNGACRQLGIPSRCVPLEFQNADRLSQRLDAFGGGRLCLAVAVFGKHAERIAVFVAGPQAFLGRARIADAGIAGGKARAGFRLGRGVQSLFQLVLFHAGKEVEGGVVVPNMLEAEMVVLTLGAIALGRLVLARLLAARDWRTIQNPTP